MQIQDAATTLRVSPRTLRHYEAVGLLSPNRDGNGYRVYAPADLRRAERIRDMIATGYSTREILAIAPCLDDANAGPCHGAVSGLKHKLEQIDRLIGDLAQKREAVVERLASLEASLADESQASDLHEDHPTAVSVSHRLPGGRRRVPARADPDAHR
ncbi:MerR family transcriptional regulator [Nitratireductor soli]|uniref:MerR family transcriptional regulator n=1 Tax=Nitratireductor soli TaxID=1670619 RepID=UPI00065DCCEB|nr:MerR family transcriptional regulator [Nitratireductor soli]